MPALLSRLSIAVLLVAATPACATPVTSRIYPAPQVPLTLDGLPTGSRMVPVTTADGLKLSGILVPGRPDRPLLLVFHGNASSAATAARWLAPLQQQDGFTILSAEYRGYSGNPGRPSEAGLLADARAFLAAARVESGGRPVWVIGHSLGGGVALSLSRSEKLDALITIGTFTRLRDMAPGLVRALLPDEYRNADAVRLLDEPFYIVHGARDGVVSAEQGRSLFGTAAGKRGRAFVIKDADHQPSAERLRTIFDSIGADLEGRPPSSANITSAIWSPAFTPSPVGK